MGAEVIGAETETRVDRSVLRFDDLSIEVDGPDGATLVVDRVSFELTKGETLCLVGESGCGKSITALAAMGLLPAVARVSAGHVWFDGRDLAAIDTNTWSGLRGNQIAMVYQDPRSSINAVKTIGEQVAETVRHHQRVSRREAWSRAVEMLDLVGIPDPLRRARDYPHEFSGGMLQRVFIAMALANDPVALIADEPTTALDVTTQRQVLDLLKDLQDEMGLSILFITHDLGVVADVADRVVVMYAGQVVEQSSTDDVFDQPRHPYTAGLLASAPSMYLDAPVQARLGSIPGVVPAPGHWPTGCRFQSRCDHAQPKCGEAFVEVTALTPTHEVRCIRAEELDLSVVTT